MSSKIRYFPGTSGMTLVNLLAAIGNNYEYEGKYFVDMTGGAGKYLVYIHNSILPVFTVDVITAGTVTAYARNSDTSSVTLTAAGVAAGEHTVKVTNDGVNTKLYIDGVEADSDSAKDVDTGGAAANSAFVNNGACVYMEYQKFTVGGVLKQHIIYQNSATVFTDLSGNSNNCTPTFRTTSTDADVSAWLASFSPITSYSYSSNTTEAESEFYSGNVTPPDEMYGENTSMSLFMADYFNGMLDEGGIPRTFWWFPLAFMTAIAGGFLVYSKSKSLLLMSIVCVFVVGFWVMAGLIPWWTIPITAVGCLAVNLAKSAFGW